MFLNSKNSSIHCARLQDSAGTRTAFQGHTAQTVIFNEVESLVTWMHFKFLLH